MRRVKKDFNFTTVTITNLETKEVASTYSVDGKTSKEREVKAFFKNNKFLPIDIKLEETKATYVQSGEDFMKYGTKIEAPKTDEVEVAKGDGIKDDTEAIQRHLGGSTEPTPTSKTNEPL
jgi:hypothetical protein